MGILLSVGIDSSLVTALVARATSKFRTFTISFPGYCEHDETEHARMIASYFAQREHLELEAPEFTVDLLPMLAR